MTVVITEDKTVYPGDDDEIISNIFEKFTVKVPATVTVPVQSEIILLEPIGRVFGEYNNQLSITAKAVKQVK